MPTLFRIAKNDPAQIGDFLSECLLGRPPRDDAMEGLLMWMGLSAWATEAQARAKARKWPTLGRYIARLELPDDTSIVVHRTNPSSRGHHTVWTAPLKALKSAMNTIPV